MNNNFLEARRFFADKIKYYYEEVTQVYNYLNVLHDLIKRIHETEHDTPSRKAKIDFFHRCQQEREVMGLAAMQQVIEYQNLLLDLYENNFVIGKKYYFF